MNTLLQLNTSLFLGQGHSSQLANEFVAAWKNKNPNGHIIGRDLAVHPIPHLDGTRFGAFVAKPEERTPAQQAIVAESDALIDEIKSADLIVLGLPLYNLGVPSQLKAYFDHIARAGMTFRYTVNGPVGLLTGKKAIVFATRGGIYAGTPKDTQTGYIRDFFSLLGITDVQFVYAEGLAIDDASRNQALAQAKDQLLDLAA